MGNSRNIRNKLQIRKPIAPPGYIIGSKKDYRRNKQEEYELIQKGLEEWEEEFENEK